jgi:RsmE family RNA methyltransferase
MYDYAKFIAGNKRPRGLLLLADQYGRPPAYYASLIESADTVCILIGPEGGLSSQEITLAQQQQIASFKLASAVLRIEAAAVAAVAVLQSAATLT